MIRDALEPLMTFAMKAHEPTDVGLVGPGDEGSVWPSVRGSVGGPDVAQCEPPCHGPRRPTARTFDQLTGQVRCLMTARTTHARVASWTTRRRAARSRVLNVQTGAGYTCFRYPRVLGGSDGTIERAGRGGPC